MIGTPIIWILIDLYRFFNHCIYLNLYTEDISLRLNDELNTLLQLQLRRFQRDKRGVKNKFYISMCLVIYLTQLLLKH